ncbi:Cox family DNA-binding protein [Pseudomonadota bacterium]
MKSENNINQQYAPFVTLEKFADLVGLTLDAVKGQVKNGKLPVMHRDGARRGRVFINMLALEEYAEEQAQEYTNWKAAI